MTRPDLRAVSEEELPEYPISVDERLDSHYFLQWNLKRWRGSGFRKRAYSDPEVGFYGFELFCMSQDETPIGTLPVDDAQLAFGLHVSLEKWQILKARPLSPLHGWYRVICDNGEVRYAHAVVTLVAQEALGSKQRNAAKNADGRMAKRLKTIRDNLKFNIPGASRVADSDEMVNRISDWIEVEWPGGSATTKRVKDALVAISSER